MMKKLTALALAALALVLVAGAGCETESRKTPGVLICVPVGSSGDSEPYWVGLREYMYFYVGGLPQLPATSAGSATRAINDRQLKNGLALSGPAAVEIARVTGHDYAVCGKVATASGRHTLVLQTWNASTGKPVGALIVRVGSQAEIAQQLKPLLLEVVDRLGIILSPGQKKAYDEIQPPTKETLTILGGVISKRDKSAVERLRQLPSDDPVIAVQQASLLDNDKSDEAVRIVKGVIAKCPEFVSPHVSLASHLMDSGKLKEASAAIEEGLARFQDSYRLLVCKHNLRDREEGAEGRLEVAEGIVKLYPRSAAAWTLISEAASDKAHDIRKSRYWAKLSAEEAETVTSLYNKIIYAAEKAVALDPKYLYAWGELQWNYMATGQDSKAEQAFKKAVAVAPGYSRAYANAIQSLEDNWSDDPDRKTKQAALVARAMKTTLDDKNWDSRRWLIDRLIENDFHKEAIIQLRAALKTIDRPLPDAHALLARVYAKQGDERHAEEEARWVIKDASARGESDLPEEYAWATFWDKSYGLSRLYFDAALALCPDCAGDYCLARAICLWETGQREKAVADWKRVLAVPGREHDLAAEFGLAVGAFILGDKEKGKAEGLRLVHIEHRLVDPEFIDDGLRWKVSLKRDARKLIDALIKDGLSLPDMGIPVPK